MYTHVHVLYLSIHVGMYVCSADNEVSSPVIQNLFDDDGDLLYCGEYYTLYVHVQVHSHRVNQNILN